MISKLSYESYSNTFLAYFDYSLSEPNKNSADDFVSVF
jgi:hypothetical protein